MANDVIEIKFGVEGGGSISGESGQLIKRQLDQLASQINLEIKIDTKSFSAQLDTLVSQINSKLGNLNIQLGGGVSTGGASGGANKSAFTQLRDQLEAVYKQFGEADKAKALGQSNYSMLAEEANTMALAYANASQAARENKLITDEQSLSLIALEGSLRETRGELARTADEEARMAREMEASKLRSVANSYEGITAKIKGYGERYADLIAHNQEAKTLYDQLVASASRPLPDNLSDAKAQMQALGTQARIAAGRFAELSVQSNTLGTQLRKALTTRVFTILSSTIVMFVINAMRQLYKNVVEINTAMTQLKIVTNDSEAAFEKFGDTVSKSAKKIGASITNLIESTTTYARLGYNLGEASKLAELTTVYSNVGNIDVGEATTNITAILKAYNVGADGLENVLDRLIYVGNNYAISSAEIGEAMNNAASSLAANGNSLDEAIGILTAANVTLQNVSKSSTAIRTIAARLSASKAELDELGESSEDVLTSANLDEKMRAFGVSITDANGELRSTYDILGDLASVWDDLDSTSRATIAGWVAGTRQQNAFYSIMQNWNDAASIVQNASSSVGALQTAQEKYIDSIQGRVNQLKATWQSFSDGLLDSAFISQLISLLNGLISVLDWVGNTFDTTALMWVGVGALAAKILIPAFRSIRNWLDNLIIGSIDFSRKFDESMDSAAIHAQKLNAVAGLLMVVATVASVAISAFKNLGTTTGDVITLILSIITLAVTTIVVLFKTADTALKSTGIYLIITVALTAVMGLISAIKGLATASTRAKEEAVEAAKESKEAWEETQKEIDDLEEKLEDLRDRIEELQKKSNSGKITLVEQQELEKLKQSVALLEQQKSSLEALGVTQEQKAQTDAADAVSKILQEKLSDAYVQEDNTWWMGFLRVLASVNTFGISDAFGFGISDWNAGKVLNPVTSEDYVNQILGDWEHATQQQKDHVTEFYRALYEQSENLTYYTGESLTEWQQQVNDAYDSVWEWIDKFTIASNPDGLNSVWDSFFNRGKFQEATDALKSFANTTSITETSLRNLYNSNGSVKELIDYLSQLGQFSWDNIDDVHGLINLVKLLRDGAKLDTLGLKSFLECLDEISESYETLKDALSDINENGKVSADTIKELLEEYPELEKFFDLTSQGYVLSSEYQGMSTDDILRTFREEYLQPFIDKIQECKAEVADIEAELSTYTAGTWEHENATERLTQAKQNLVNAEKSLQNAQAATNTLLEESDSTYSTLLGYLRDYQDITEWISDLDELSAADRVKVAELQKKITDLVGEEYVNFQLLNGEVSENVKKLAQLAYLKQKERVEEERARKAEEAAEAKQKADTEKTTADDARKKANSKKAELEEAQRRLAELNDAMYNAEPWQQRGYVGAIMQAQEEVSRLREEYESLNASAEELEQTYKDALSAYNDILGKQYTAQDFNTALDLVGYYQMGYGDTEFNSVEDYRAFREELIEAAKGNEVIAALLEANVISDEDLIREVDTWLAENLEYWYDMNLQEEELKTYLSILQEVEGEYDTLRDAIDSFNEHGVVASDAIEKLLEDFPGLEKYLKWTEELQGYVLADKYDGWGADEILLDYINDYLRGYVDALAECEEGTEEYAQAYEDLRNAIAACNTVLKENGIETEFEDNAFTMKKSAKTYVELLDEIGDRFSSLSDAVESFNEHGVVASEEIKDLLENFPELEKYLKWTEELQGYVLSDEMNGWSAEEVLIQFVNDHLKTYVDALAECEEGTEDWQIAWEELQNAIAAANTLLRENGIAAEFQDNAFQLQKAAKTYLSILQDVSDDFDMLAEAIDSVNENGIVASDTIQQLLEDFPGLEKYLKWTEELQGYVLADKYDGWNTSDILKDFAADYLQQYVNDLAACEEGTEEYAEAQETLNNAVAAFATLLRAQQIQEERENLERQKDALEDQKDILDEQLDNYRDLCDLRKDLLKSYKDELDYQKELAKKQQNVSDLETQLAVARLDTSAAGQARVRELEAELQDAQEELEDFTLEHAIDVLCDEIDNGYNEYELFIKGELEKIEELIESIEQQIEDLPRTIEVEVPLPEPEEQTKPDDDNETGGGDGDNGGGSGGETTNPGDEQTPQEPSTKPDKTPELPWKDELDKRPWGDGGFSKWRPNVPWRDPNFKWDRLEFGTSDKMLSDIVDKVVEPFDRFEGLLKEHWRNDLIEIPEPPIDDVVKGIKDAFATQKSDVNINSPLVSVQCETVTKDALPQLEDIVNQAVGKVKSQLDNVFSRSGFKGTVNKFSI